MKTLKEFEKEKGRIHHLFNPYAQELKFDEKDWEVFFNRFEEVVKAYLKEVLKEVLKHNKVGWGFNTRYDKGFNDGYNQAVCELNQEIRKLKGE